MPAGQGGCDAFEAGRAGGAGGAGDGARCGSEAVGANRADRGTGCTVRVKADGNDQKKRGVLASMPVIRFIVWNDMPLFNSTGKFV